MSEGFCTKCIHGNKNEFDNTGAISVPIYQSATFAHQGLGKSTGFDYSRLGNPTREQLEKTMTQLEGGKGSLAFSTGMGATSSLMEIFEPGDHIIASEDIYGGTYRYFHMITPKRCIQVEFVDTSNLDAVRAAINEKTRAIFIESPTNPMMNVTDIAAVGVMTADRNILLIVDNTFMTPYFQNPIALGADVVIHSGTKYLGGHNDTLAGILVFNDETLFDKVQVIAKTLGACLSPFDSWLILRGIKTLPVRMERQQSNAIALAKWLDKQGWVKRLYYVGDENSPGLRITEKQATGFGAMISFEVDSVDRVKALLEGVRVIQFAESLGGVESLITYPVTQTHADVPVLERDAKGINNRLLRFSVGLEDLGDLVKDLEQAAGRI